MDKVKIAYAETIKLWQNTDDPDYSQKLNAIITQLNDSIQEADYTAKKQSECPYCHTYRKSRVGQEFARPLYDKIEYWDDYKKTKVRKKVVTQIVSPLNKHSRLRSKILFRHNDEHIFDIGIQYCPKCGRRLG